MFIYTLPIIAAFTGWLTNFIAVKMLFHPRVEKKILFIRVQGIFPKRQKSLAEKLGKIVSTELFSISDLKSSLASNDTSKEITGVVGEKIDNFLNNKLAASMPMLGMFLNDGIKQQIKDTLMLEFTDSMPEIIERLTSKLESSVDIETIVYDKVVAFSTDKLEEILYAIMKKEFRFIEVLGGILGFVIGLIQIALLQLD